MKERHQEPPLELVQSRALPYLAVSMACIFQMFPQLCSAKGDVGFQIADCGLRIADFRFKIATVKARSRETGVRRKEVFRFVFLFWILNSGYWIL